MNKRVAVISEHASPLAAAGGVDAGGQNIYVANTVRELAALGYELDVFTRRDSPDLPRIAAFAAGVRVIHVPAGPAHFVSKERLLPFMDDFAARIIAIAAEARNDGRPYDLVHAHFFMSALVASKLKRALDIPFVVTFHALGKVRLQYQDDDCFPAQRVAIEQAVIDDADAIIAECPQDEHDLVTLYDADEARIAVVPCGYDPAEMQPVSRAEARRRIGLPEHGRVLLQLGRIVPRKGIDTVVRAVALLKSAHELRTTLVIVGGESDQPDVEKTPELARLIALAKQEGVEDCVVFAGRKARHELKYYYSAADFFLTTPWYEPFGITPLEAMACGTPVIGSRVGGIKFSVVEGRTGFLVAPNDHRALARRLAHLYSDTAIRSFLGRQSQRRAKECFTWRKVTRSIADLYEDVLARRSGSFERAAQAIPIQHAGRPALAANARSAPRGAA